MWCCPAQVVLATNIAETSITIDDVVFVVDGGKCKEKTFEPSRSMSTLTVEVSYSAYPHKPPRSQNFLYCL